MPRYEYQITPTGGSISSSSSSISNSPEITSINTNNANMDDFVYFEPDDNFYSLFEEWKEPTLAERYKKRKFKVSGIVNI